jgi:hypothetical protein
MVPNTTGSIPKLADGEKAFAYVSLPCRNFNALKRLKGSYSFAKYRRRLDGCPRLAVGAIVLLNHFLTRPD